MDQLNFFDTIRDQLNSLNFRLRSTIKFRRSGYSEKSPPLRLTPDAQAIHQRFGAQDVLSRLSAPNALKTLATLWQLEQIFSDLRLPRTLNVLEPACQDFSRLPAYRLFFQERRVRASITGIEIDPFVLLSNFHSRWDKAEYYISLDRDKATYLESNFFQFYRPSELIVCFYPFVSAGPALAWGLPAHVASPISWVHAFERNLATGGLALVVHQGEWEEEDFDQARAGSHLALVKRQILDCPFWKSRHLACASLYRKV